MGKSTINGHFQWLFWHNQRVTDGTLDNIPTSTTFWRIRISGTFRVDTLLWYTTKIPVLDLPKGSSHEKKIPLAIKQIVGGNQTWLIMVNHGESLILVDTLLHFSRIVLFLSQRRLLQAFFWNHSVPCCAELCRTRTRNCPVHRRALCHGQCALDLRKVICCLSFMGVSENQGYNICEHHFVSLSGVFNLCCLWKYLWIENICEHKLIDSVDFWYFCLNMLG